MSCLVPENGKLARHDECYGNSVRSPCIQSACQPNSSSSTILSRGSSNRLQDGGGGELKKQRHLYEQILFTKLCKTSRERKRRIKRREERHGLPLESTLSE